MSLLAHWHGLAKYGVASNDPRCPVCNADGHLGESHKIHPMAWGIQWYDPYDLTAKGRARKDGKPVGRFATRSEAEAAAEESCLKHGVELPYVAVEIP